MHIRDFSDTYIRIGDFPYCIDVGAIPNFHSSYGLLCTLFTHTPVETEEKPRIMLIKPKGYEDELKLVVMQWPKEQFEKLPDEIKTGKILFDSYQNTK